MKKNNDYNPFETLHDEDINIIIEILEKEIKLIDDSINRCKVGGRHWAFMTGRKTQISRTLERTLNLKLREFF